jgi:hypothetical protein
MRCPRSSRAWLHRLPHRVVLYPDPDIGVDSLAGRKRHRWRRWTSSRSFIDFQFTDKLKESGITFVNHAVDDARKNYVPSRYDHGNGIAVADVDGDGLYDIYFIDQVGGNELWKNLGNSKFRNITKESGVGLPGRISVAAAFADIDNDGDQPEVPIANILAFYETAKTSGRYPLRFD